MKKKQVDKIVKFLLNHKNEIYRKIMLLKTSKYISYGDVYKFFDRQEFTFKFSLDTLMGELLTTEQRHSIVTNFYDHD